MKNFDDLAPEELDSARGPHVEIGGDPASVAEAFRKAASASALSVSAKVREDMMKGVLGDLSRVPKIDLSRLMGPSPQLKKLEIPKRPDPVLPEHIEAVTAAVNSQTTAIHALHRGVQMLAERVEVLAERGDSRTRWIIGLSAAIALLGWVVAVLTALLVWMA
jgi:hypothetical protein